jgi:putative ABC transport system permease protein
MLLDLKAACRELLRNPWFACITVFTLALGIGANTAIFAVVNRVLLNPLPYPDSDRLVYLKLGSERLPFTIAVPTLLAHNWREQARSLEGMEAYAARDVLANRDDGARVIHAIGMTPGLPAFLGVSPQLGRSFGPADASPGAPAVTMLSHQTWQRDYGGSEEVLGRAITIDGVSRTIIGVMPVRWDAFAPVRADVWFPLALDLAPGSTGAVLAVELMARLQPDSSVDAVRNELDELYRRTVEEIGQPLGPEDVRSRVISPAEIRIGSGSRDALFVLLAAVGLLLLVACSNVANLFLARGAARARGFALRAALGASIWRLVRGLLSECLVLALAAGIVGVLLGWLTLALLVRLRPNSLPALADVRLDTVVLLFTFTVSVATALVFGLAPAWQLASGKLNDALRHGASGVVRAGGGTLLRKGLIAAQMAISVVLLVSAGLLVRSVVYLQHVDVGFNSSNLITVQLSLPRAKYGTAPSRDVLAEQLLDQLRSLPGIASATQAFIAPPGIRTSIGNIEVRGRAVSDANARAGYAFNQVRSNYFSVLGIRLLEGRTFTSDEQRNGGAVIVNEAFAERFWPEGNALGAEINLRDWLTVVGVVDNVLSGGLMAPRDAPQFYLPFFEVPGTGATPSIELIARAATDPADVISQLRAAIQAVDPEIAIANLLLTDTALANSIDGPRFNMVLLTAFAVLAVALAAVGLASVIGYEVAERTHEIGIRVALGARTVNVRLLAMKHGLTPALLGVAIGVLGALLATQLATRMLYGVAPRDPLTFVGVVTLLLLVAMGASWMPARGATRVDPIIALRAD